MLAESPDHVVSVHPTPVAALSVLWSRGMRIPPTPRCSPISWRTQWIHPHVDRYCVPAENRPRSHGTRRAASAWWSPAPGGPGVGASSGSGGHPAGPRSLPAAARAPVHGRIGWRLRPAGGRDAQDPGDGAAAAGGGRDRPRGGAGGAAAQPRRRARDAREGVRLRGQRAAAHGRGRLSGDQGRRAHPRRGAGRGAADDLLRLAAGRRRATSDSPRWRAWRSWQLRRPAPPRHRGGVARSGAAPQHPDRIRVYRRPQAADHRGLVLTQPDSARVRAS